MATFSTAFSDGAVKCQTITPLVHDKVQFRKDRGFHFKDIDSGNLSLPRLDNPVALDVLSFVAYQAMQAYSGSLELCKTAYEYGLQTHLHKMMLFVVSCCPPPEEEVLGAVEAVGYLSDLVRVEVDTPNSSPTASRTGEEPGKMAAAPAAAGTPGKADHKTATAVTPPTAAAPGEGLAGSEQAPHKQQPNKQRSDKQHGTKLETEEPMDADPLAGRIEIVVLSFLQHLFVACLHVPRALTLPAMARS